MNKLSIVLIEKSSYWHLSVWKRNVFLPVLLNEKKYGKLNPEELISSIFADIQYNYPQYIKNTVWYICLDPKNVIIKEWKFPFSSAGKIKKAVNIMLDAEMPQASLFTHTTIINKKEKNEKETTAYTLSCLTSFLTFWYSLLDQYDAAKTKITFLPFPYILGQNYTEEKIYLALYDETFFSFSYKEKSIKKIRYIQLVKGEQNNTYVNAAINFILPKTEQSEFIILDDKKQELKEYINKDIKYTSYRAIPKFQFLSNLLKKCKMLKRKSTFKQTILGDEHIIAYNLLLAFNTYPLFFVHKNTTTITYKNSLFDKLLNPNFVPYYLIIFCIILGLNALAVNLMNIKHENEVYLTEIQNSYKKAVPSAPYFSNFKQLKSVIINKISPELTVRQQNTPLSVLELISELLPDKQKIILTSFSMNKNGVSINASTVDYEELDNITNVLKKSSNISNVKVTNASIIKGQNVFPINFELTFNIGE